MPLQYSPCEDEHSDTDEVNFVQILFVLEFDYMIMINDTCCDTYWHITVFINLTVY